MGHGHHPGRCQPQAIAVIRVSAPLRSNRSQGSDPTGRNAHCRDCDAHDRRPPNSSACGDTNSRILIAGWPVTLSFAELALVIIRRSHR